MNIDGFEHILSAARPRALGALLRVFHQLELVEDAFQEACLRALKHWPQNGLPRDPLAWLIFVAKNAAIDILRKQRHVEKLHELELFEEEHFVMEATEQQDDILRLLFICCHPSLQITQQMALALRVVAGLSTREIARAFLVKTETMEKRITRAKERIACTDTSFTALNKNERLTHIATVSGIIYLMFNEGYSASSGEAQIRYRLCDEAIRLARLLLHLFPANSELMGLLALFLLQHARSPARLSAEGAIILLEQQERGLWNSTMINEGLILVEKAFRRGTIGPYQIESAIAATHNQASCYGDTDWQEIERLYIALETIKPSPIVTLNKAVASYKAHGAKIALAIITPLAKELESYFNYHGFHALLLKETGEIEAAKRAFERALSLSNTAAEALHIRAQMDVLEEIDSYPN